MPFCLRVYPSLHHKLQGSTDATNYCCHPGLIMSIMSNENNIRAEVRRCRGYLFIFSPPDQEPGAFMLACVKGEAAQGPFFQCGPVSLSPPLCLDAFETGRGGMRLGEGKLRDEWLHVLSCFYSTGLFSPQCVLSSRTPQSRAALLCGSVDSLYIYTFTYT